MLARRSGSTWYMGAMTADEARTTRVSLDFLPAGRYQAIVWEDGKAPDELRRSERIVTARDTLALRLAVAGGAAVVLEPAR